MLWMSELGNFYSSKIRFWKDNVGENVLGANFYIKDVFVGDIRVYSKRAKLDFSLVWCVRYSSSAHTAHITLDVKSSISSPQRIIYYYIFFGIFEVVKCFLDGILLRNVLNFESNWTCLFFCIIIVTPVFNLVTLLIKILLEWSAKDLEILQAKNIALRLQRTKFSVLRIIPRFWCSCYLQFQNLKLKFEIQNQNL